MTHGRRCRPSASAFFATRPAATISAGLDVFVHDVIAEITTDPSPSCVPFCVLTPNASENERATWGSDTRSCGRRGPARLGTTASRSRSSVSE